MTPLKLSLDPPVPKNTSKVPRCAACGRRLSKYDANSHRNRELAARSLRHIVGARPVPVFLHEVGLPNELAPLTADGSAPTRGAYGDNLVCSQVCGHVLAVRLIAALGAEVLQLMPEPWRHR